MAPTIIDMIVNQTSANVYELFEFCHHWEKNKPIWSIILTLPEVHLHSILMETMQFAKHYFEFKIQSSALNREIKFQTILSNLHLFFCCYLFISIMNLWQRTSGHPIIWVHYEKPQGQLGVAWGRFEVAQGCLRLTQGCSALLSVA